MKIIRLEDMEDIPAEDVKPGMVIAEGIVARVERQGTDTIFFYTVADGTSAWTKVGKKVQVYAKLSDHMMEVLVKIRA